MSSKMKPADSVGTCLFCGASLKLGDFRPATPGASPKARNFYFRGMLRAGCAHHPGVHEVSQQLEPPPPQRYR